MEGAANVRRQAHLAARSDSAEVWLSRLQGFSTNTPEAGIPISAPKVILRLTIDIRKHPNPAIVIPKRFVTDLGRFMHDARGAFDIEVQCSWSLGLKACARSLPDGMIFYGKGGGDGLFKLALFDTVEVEVHDLICFSAVGQYNRPIRPAYWTFKRELKSAWPAQNQLWFEKESDGQSVRAWHTGRELAQVSCNVATKSGEWGDWVNGVCDIVGLQVHTVERIFGNFWISWVDVDRVICELEKPKRARKFVHVWTATGRSRGNDGGHRWLILRGWHVGPHVDERKGRSVIQIFTRHDIRKYEEAVGFSVLSALPLALC